MENYSPEDIAPAAERVRSPHFDIHSSSLHICPYNPNHRVPRNKLEMHLIKCREVYGPCGLAVCAFNILHHIPSEQMEEHQRVLLKPSFFQNIKN